MDPTKIPPDRNLAYMHSWSCGLCIRWIYNAWIPEDREGEWVGEGEWVAYFLSIPTHGWIPKALAEDRARVVLSLTVTYSPQLKHFKHIINDLHPFLENVNSPKLDLQVLAYRTSPIAWNNIPSATDYLTPILIKPPDLATHPNASYTSHQCRPCHHWTEQQKILHLEFIRLLLQSQLVGQKL